MSQQTVQDNFSVEVDGFRVGRGQVRGSVTHAVNQKGVPRGVAILALYHWDQRNQGEGLPLLPTRGDRGSRGWQELSAGCKTYFKMTITRKSTVEVTEFVDDLE